MAGNDLLDDIDPAFLAAATAAAAPHAVTSVSSDPVTSSPSAPVSPNDSASSAVSQAPDDPSSFANMGTSSLDAALLNFDSDCTQSGRCSSESQPSHRSHSCSQETAIA